MNSIAAFNSARAAVTRTDDVDRGTRAERGGERLEDSREASARAASKQAEFSALLALLAGTGARVRSDILKQLPAEGASLVDRLLSEAGDASADAATDTGSETGDASGTSASEGRADAGTANLQGNAHGAQTAADAIRYGQLMRSDAARERAPGSPAGSEATDSAGTPDQPMPQTARSKGVSGLIGLANALGHGGNADALSRIVSRRGATVEQLLALGDERGADARAALDGILAQAGTESGQQLAALTGDAASMPAAAAAAAALIAASAKSRADVARPVREADALVPEFRGRVERVIARMKQEYGHDVTLVETARSQDRQDFLFEQGRTRPGNVVTWTRDSAHTRGEAADLLVDGTYDNAEGFARLQRIAREEGLRTLGVKDPGHVELPRNARQADAMLGGAAKVSARIEGTGMQSSNAASPTVASVASVASVAGVARVAEAPTAAPGAATGAGMYAAMGAAAGPADAGNASSNGNAFGKGERDGDGRPINEGRKLGQQRDDNETGTPRAFGHVAGPAAGSAAAAAAAKTDGALPLAGADAAARVADLQDRRDATPGSISRLSLSVDGENGADRITIDLRGKSVGTRIDTDAATASGLRSRTGELQEALGRHGLDADTVRISGSLRGDSADATRGVSAERDGFKLAASQGASNDSAASNGQRERSANAREWDNKDEARRAREEQRDAKHEAKQDAKDAKRDGRQDRPQQRYSTEGQR